jgi:hypothetical protein
MSQQGFHLTVSETAIISQQSQNMEATSHECINIFWTNVYDWLYVLYK